MKVLYWAVSFVVFVALLVFCVANRQPVDVWPLAVQMPLAFVVLMMLVLGLAAGLFIAWIGGRHWRRLARERERRIAALEKELAASVTQRDQGPPASGAPPLPRA